MPTTTEPPYQTTTPDPCICENLPDKFTINVKTGLFRDYCRRAIPQDKLGDPYLILHAEEIGPAWLIDNKMVELEIPWNPFLNPANIFDVGLEHKGSVPMVFRKLGNIKRENCQVYASRNNSIPLITRIFTSVQQLGEFDPNLPNPFISQRITLKFEAVLFLRNGEWHIKFVIKGNLADGFPTKFMINIEDCPQDGEFVDLDNDGFVDDIDINDIGSNELETIPMRLPPFKNSVLGF